MSQASKLVRPALDGVLFTLTDDVDTTPIIEMWGRSRTWIYSASSITVAVYGSLKPDGTFVEPDVATALTTINGLVMLPDSYWGIPYLKFEASTGTPQIQIGGMG